jgi:Ran GTPase-activating protein (RanGAP) involved in mRNA processing and transport
MKIPARNKKSVFMNKEVRFFAKDGRLRSDSRGLTLQECSMPSIVDSVQHVEVRWTGIDDKFTLQFALFLKGCTNLASIDLADNYIGDSGCKELAESLSGLMKLEKIFLSGNRVGDLGFAILSSMLLANSTVTELDISGNNIRKTGMQALGSSLRENKSLRMLKLDELFFGDDGAGIDALS